MKNGRRNINLGIKISVLLAILGLLVIVYTKITIQEQEHGLIYCDFEDFSISNGKVIFSTNEILTKIKVSTECSSDIYLSGSNSMKVNKNEFVNLYSITKPNPNEAYKVSIYRNSGTAGIVVQEEGAEKPSVYKFEKHICDTLDNGWGKIEVQLRTPPNYSGNNLKIYIWNPDKQISYFDDFKVEEIEYMTYPEYDGVSALNIFIEDKEMTKLGRVRNLAFDKGVLVTNDDSYVDAIVTYEGKFMQAEVRFKGDWLDHLENDKWSLRIKLIDDSWLGMCTFSIHTPFSRSFIDEWFLHQILKDNDILTTRYGFVPVRLNNRSLGIYAYEEHFDKQLVESSLRREGPIMSFSEEELWHRRSLKSGALETFIFKASTIKPFGEGRLLKSPSLYTKFILAQNLIESFKSGKLKASEVFDIPQTAKYFAFLTKFGAYHGAVWHNLRFYYNPVTSRIEPIAYDCYSNWGIFTWGHPEILGNFYPGKDNQLPDYSSFYIDFLTDPDFLEYYKQELVALVGSENLQIYLDKYHNELLYLENLITKEFLNYHFDEAMFFTHSDHIDTFLIEFTKNLSRKSYIDSLVIKSEKINNRINPDTSKTLFNDYVEVYKNSENSISVIVTNHENIKIIGFGTENEIKVNSNYSIENLQKTNWYSSDLTISQEESKYKYVYFSAFGPEYRYSKKITPWPAPTTYNPHNDIAQRASDISNFTNEEKREVRFSGNISFDNHVYIPAGYTVIFDAGTNIDITNKSAFISNSTILINGTKENPVKIYSSDKSANAFTVLQADELSVCNYAVFDNLNTLDYNGWTLTGAVTFYESDVEFHNCSFTNNHCEDMLNTIRCDFLVKDCLIQNTYGDSHDSDFCTGTLDNCTFINNGNDAIDFSTSDVIIANCKINGAGDKGISVGENTKANIKNVEFNNIEIGISSKDLSHAEIDGCKISNATYGFVLLQKKPEFGPATIIAKNCILVETWKEHLIEKKSVLTLNGKRIEGKSPKLKTMFYE
ncbi:MAG: CotH kinase family protein [Bacteroidales bacterium]|nr:CotH kinase family protein [Bacteroidales bacterium]